MEGKTIHINQNLHTDNMRYDNILTQIIHQDSVTIIFKHFISSFPPK